MNKTGVITIVILIIIIALGVTVFNGNDEANQANTTDQNATSTGSVTATTAPIYTLAEIAPHNNQNDCWIAIEGKVYDVTQMIPNHPGGPSILQGCGKDATELFNTRPMGSGTPHSQQARSFLPNFYIGELSQS